MRYETVITHFFQSPLPCKPYIFTWMAINPVISARKHSVTCPVSLNQLVKNSRLQKSEHKSQVLPAKKKCHIEEGTEVGEELEGEHLDCETFLRVSKCPCLFC